MEAQSLRVQGLPVPEINEDDLKEIYYENYVSSFTYVPADLGEVPELRYRGNSNCGAELLGPIDGRGYLGVEGKVFNCGYWEEDLPECYVMNSTRKGVEFIGAF